MKKAEPMKTPKSGVKVKIQFAEKPPTEDMPDDVGLGDTPEEEAGETKEFEKYELENAVDTLHKAEEIKQNPALMKAIGPLLDKKSKAVKSLDDLRAVAKEKLAGQY